MATKRWSFDLESVSHSVALSDDLFWGRRRVQIDDGPWLALNPIRRQFSLDRDYTISIGSHEGILHITRVGAAYRYELILDGLSVETGLRPAPAPPVPWRGWIFVALCGVLLAGGALGAGCGACGGIFCYGIARDGSQPTALRALIFAGVAILCWIVYFVLASLFQSAVRAHHL